MTFNSATTPPTPINTYGALYADAVSSQTYPFWVRDGSAEAYPLLPIKAFARISVVVSPPGVAVVQTIVNSSNIASVTLNTATRVFTFNFTNALPDTNYLVFPSTTSLNITTFSPAATSNFTVTVTGGGLLAGTTLNAFVIEA